MTAYLGCEKHETKIRFVLFTARLKWAVIAARPLYYLNICLTVLFVVYLFFTVSFTTAST